MSARSPLRLSWRRRVAMAVTVPVVAATGACSTSPGDVVSVVITDAGIGVTADEPRSGRVRFEIDNETDKTHDLVLIQGDDPSALTLTPQGSVDLDVHRPVDEIPDLPPGYFMAQSPNVRPGDYIWVCTIVEGEGEGAVSHFQTGMFDTFEVVPRRPGDDQTPTDGGVIVEDEGTSEP